MNTRRTFCAFVSPEERTRPCVHRLAGRQPERGLSMIEMMVTVALLTVIILGLVAMFNQTRKAFTTGLANVDWQDAGRVTVDMIARDLEQMAPVNPSILLTNSASSSAYYSNAVNFYVDYEPTFFSQFGLNLANGFNTNWLLPGGDLLPITMQRLLFSTRYNQQWNMIGYRVDPTGANGGVGVLYRYSASGPANGSNPNPLTVDFITGNNSSTPPPYASTNSPLPFNRVIDGVVDFRIQPYDLNGIPITNMNSSIIMYTGAAMTNNFLYEFQGTAVPAYVEVELGILETPTLERYRSFSGPNAVAFLTSHAGQVHFFRRRIRIHGVDPTAYHFP